jgi:hypothetical protein
MARSRGLGDVYKRQAGGPMGALPWEHFYDNGQLAEKDSYRNGIRIGLWEERQ